MTLASCPHSTCAWEVDFPDEQTADAGRIRHEQRKHQPPATATVGHLLAQPVVPIRQFPAVEWRTRALDAIAQLAASGRNFTIFEISEYGVGEPPSPRTDWGKLTRDAEHLGLIEHARDNEGRELSTRSTRPATRGSLVSVWRAGRRTA